MKESELRTGTRNVVSMFMLATALEVEEGRIWYAQARAVAYRLGVSFGRETNVAAGVLAALSPHNRWSRNVLDAESTMQAHGAGLGVESVRAGTYRNNVRKAWSILDGEVSPAGAFDVRTGPKTEAFFRLIANPSEEDAVCVDGHAYAIWMGERIVVKANKVRPGRQYEAIAGDYRQAARFLGLLPHQVQAVTWTAYRRIHGQDWDKS